ncbi:MAG: hypothetical protein HPY85_13965 [Anaerolineae bacterium]|nr:hypothetical protein [Anaerolineae bacterium]
MNRRRRDRDRWGRVFVLLIFVMLGILLVDRINAMEGLKQTQPDAEFTPTTDVLLESPNELPEETYPFLPPTVIPLTPSPTPTQVLTPTPPAPLVEIPVPTQTGTPPVEPWLLPTPIGAVNGIVARCMIAGKQIQYQQYDLASNIFRPLSEPFYYLASPNNIETQAYTSGAVEQGCSVENFLRYPIPASWKQDRNYEVIGVSGSQKSLVVQRFGLQDAGIYWLDQVTQEIRLLFDWSGVVSEAQYVPALDGVLLQLPDTAGIENLYLVRLSSGAVDWLTEFETSDVYGGRISPDGSRLAYWTDQGVWVVFLDGSFAALTFANSTHPAWAPDSSRLAVVQGGQVLLSDFGRTSLEVIGAGFYGESPQWVPDGDGVVAWRKDGATCEWRMANLRNGQITPLLRLPNRECQPVAGFRFSADGLWMLGVLPTSTRSGDVDGVVLCDLRQQSCRVLGNATGYDCDSAAWSILLPAFTWEFSDENHGWRLIQQVQNRGVDEGAWQLETVGNFPIIASPVNLGVNASIYTILEITLRIDAGDTGTLYIVTDQERFYDDRKSFSFPLISDGEYHRYRFNMAAWPEWRGVINGLRIRLGESDGTAAALDQVQILAP